MSDFLYSLPDIKELDDTLHGAAYEFYTEQLDHFGIYGVDIVTPDGRIHDIARLLTQTHTRPESYAITGYLAKPHSQGEQLLRACLVGIIEAATVIRACESALSSSQY